MMKRCTARFLIFFFVSFCLHAVSFDEILNLINSNYYEINNRLLDYEQSIKKKNDKYAPSVSVGGGTSFENDISSSLSYTQPLPGGSAVTLSAQYSQKKLSEGSGESDIRNTVFSVSFLQSLYPYWLQGRLADPFIENVKHESEISFYQYEASKKEVIKKAVELYYASLIYENEIQIFEREIDFIDSKISASYEMLKKGSANQITLNNLEDSKWTYIQSLMEAKKNYSQSMNMLELMCNIKFETGIEYTSPQDIIALIEMAVDTETDGTEKIYQLQMRRLENEKILLRQTAAPAVNVSYKSGYSNITQDISRSFSMGIDFSSFLQNKFSDSISAVEAEIQKTDNLYRNYLASKYAEQDAFLFLVQEYEKEKESIHALYEKYENIYGDMKMQFEGGAISELDLKSAAVKKDVLERQQKILCLRSEMYQMYLLLKK